MKEVISTLTKMTRTKVLSLGTQAFVASVQEDLHRELNSDPTLQVEPSNITFSATCMQPG